MVITRWRQLASTFLAIILLLLSMGLVSAQDEEVTPETETGTVEATPAATAAPAGSILYITGANTDSIPTVGIRMYGMDATGRAINPNETAVTIRQQDTVVSVDEIAPEPVGTLTIFLLDATPGVEDQLDDIQGMIERYASPDLMTEQVDYVTIYRVVEESATQLLPPERFYNSVRNFFVTPLETHSGPTALIDSLYGLLDQVQSLKPNPDMFASIVLITDGTDPLSTQDRAGLAPRAKELGVPIHTVWLQNLNLKETQQASGRDFLTSLAEQSRGFHATATDPAAIDTIFDAITAFTNHWRLSYTVPDATGGTFPVEIGLLHEPGVTAQTNVTFSGSTPQVNLNIPEDSRNLALPDLEEPVTLSFSAQVGWLDGVARSVEQAQLVVNEQVVQDIPPDSLNNFQAEVSNLTFGENTVQVVIADNQGLQARSPVIRLNITQGAQQIPPELAPSTPWTRYAVYCLVALAVIAALAGLGFLVMSRRGAIGRPRRQPAAATPGATGSAALQTEMFVRDELAAATSSGIPVAYLEVMQADSRVSPQMRLVGTQTRLGRSPDQADLAFENDLTVSRLHATITWDGEMYHIYDENSTSGTWVNDQQVVNYGLQLLDGDEIYLGKVALRFHIPDGR
jgi:hypothetical protein